MTANSYAKPALYRQNPPPHSADRSSRATADATLEFGRFRVLLRERRLVSDGVPIEVGTRALDLLLVLLEADGSLVTKDELMSRVWPGIVVAEENLKGQICALRKALGEYRDFIHRDRPRLSVHCRSSLGRRQECLSAPNATWAPVNSKIGFPKDLSTTAARLVRREVTLADAVILLTPTAAPCRAQISSACKRERKHDNTLFFGYL